MIRGYAPSCLTVVRPDGGRDEYRDHTDFELGRIQTALESQLRSGGWTLERFTPERRRTAERRAEARAAPDRRRPKR